MVELYTKYFSILNKFFGDMYDYFYTILNYVCPDYKTALKISIKQVSNKDCKTIENYLKQPTCISCRLFMFIFGGGWRKDNS